MPVDRERMEGALEACRAETHSLVASLDDGELRRVRARCMGPILWDLCHIAYFEELWVARRCGGRDPINETFDRVFDAFRSPRTTREQLPMPSSDEARSYLDRVRETTLEVLKNADFESDHGLLRDGFLFRMILQHEEQHQETILQALDIPTRGDRPVLATRAGVNSPRTNREVDLLERVEIPDGECAVGTNRWGGVYDNERPRHSVSIPAFFIEKFPVTVGRYCEFVEGGGYDEREVWSNAGWAWREAERVERPQGWVEIAGDSVRAYRLGELSTLDPREPVQHVSWFEADAFARWTGARMPTEAEWEKAARWSPEDCSPRSNPWGEEAPSHRLANVARAAWGPRASGDYPDGASALGVEQMIGDVYEWTSSEFHGYPRFEAFPYREYSQAFFGKTYKVLRGSSWAAGKALARATYRNWDLPHRRQLFAGVRLAWNAE